MTAPHSSKSTSTSPPASRRSTSTTPSPMSRSRTRRLRTKSLPVPPTRARRRPNAPVAGGRVAVASPPNVYMLLPPIDAVAPSHCYNLAVFLPLFGLFDNLAFRLLMPAERARVCVGGPGKLAAKRLSGRLRSLSLLPSAFPSPSSLRPSFRCRVRPLALPVLLPSVTSPRFIDRSDVALLRIKPAHSLDCSSARSLVWRGRA